MTLINDKITPQAQSDALAALELGLLKDDPAFAEVLATALQPPQPRRSRWLPGRRSRALRQMEQDLQGDHDFREMFGKPARWLKQREEKQLKVSQIVRRQYRRQRVLRLGKRGLGGLLLGVLGLAIALAFSPAKGLFASGSGQPVHHAAVQPPAQHQAEPLTAAPAAAAAVATPTATAKPATSLVTVTHRVTGPSHSTGLNPDPSGRPKPNPDSNAQPPSTGDPLGGIVAPIYTPPATGGGGSTSSTPPATTTPPTTPPASGTYSPSGAANSANGATDQSFSGGDQTMSNGEPSGQTGGGAAPDPNNGGNY